MKVAFHVNAMLTLEGGSTRVLCDPWVTFDDVSHCDFYNFPRSALSRADVRNIDPDYIYITHTHPDHFDPETLSLFPLDTPILVAPYKANFTERAVRRLGFTDVRVVPMGEGLPLNGDDHCWIEPSAAYPEVDSVGVFRLGGATAVNLNDNAYHAEQLSSIRDRLGPVDIGLVPSGGHGPWPMFFDNYSPAEKARLAAGRAAQQLETFVKTVETLGPKLVIPIAGGLVAGGPRVHEYIYSGINPRSVAVSSAEKALPDTRFVLLSEGAEFDLETGESSGPYVERTYETEADYLGEIAKKPGRFSPGGSFHIAPSERIDLTNLLTVARQTQKKWQERRGIVSEKAYYFDVGEPELYRLSLCTDDVTRIAESDIADAEFEIFRLPYELLLGFLTRHYNWSNAKTQYVTYHRPGPYDRNLLLLMSYLQI